MSNRLTTMFENFRNFNPLPSPSNLFAYVLILLLYSVLQATTTMMMMLTTLFERETFS
jgi:hypothetical protein